MLFQEKLDKKKIQIKQLEKKSIYRMCKQIDRTKPLYFET